MSPAGHPSDDQLDAATWCRHLVPDGSVYTFLADLWVPRISFVALTCCFAPVSNVRDDRQPWRR